VTGGPHSADFPKGVREGMQFPCIGALEVLSPRDWPREFCVTQCCFIVLRGGQLGRFATDVPRATPIQINHFRILRSPNDHWRLATNEVVGSQSVLCQYLHSYIISCILYLMKKVVWMGSSREDLRVLERRAARSGFSWRVCKKVWILTIGNPCLLWGQG
jgi:hypothetical protein